MVSEIMAYAHFKNGPSHQEEHNSKQQQQQRCSPLESPVAGKIQRTSAQEMISSCVHILSAGYCIAEG